MTTATQTVGQTIANSTKMTIDLGNLLAEAIPAEQFATAPQGVNCNHPAWVYGHCAIYPDMVLNAIGKPELAKPMEGYEKLFEHGSPSTNDPSCTTFPSKDELLAYFNDRYTVLGEALANTSDETLAAPSPFESMRDRLPTLGDLAGFLASGHTMMHLGQVSTWRRCMGLGPAM